MRIRRKRFKPPKRYKRRWLTRRDFAFFGFFVFLLIASIVTAHMPHTTQSSQALIPFSSSSAPTSTVPGASSSTSLGGQGGLPPGQNASSNQAPTFNMQGTAPTPAPTAKGIGNDWLVGKTGLLAWTDPQITYANDKLRTAWGGALATADLFLVLFIIINGIRVSLGAAGFRYAEVLEALPRIVISFIAAHLSWYFIGSLITINNGMCQSIIAVAQQNNLAYTQGLDFPTVLKQALTLVGTLVLALVAQAFDQGAPAWAAFALSAISVLVSLTLLLLYVFLAIQLIIRLALLNLLTIVSPFGFASWALPQGAGQQLMRIQVNATFACTLVQFLQLACYIFGLILLNPVAWAVYKAPVLGFFGIEPASLFEIAVVWITLRVPGLIQNVTTHTMGEGSRNMASTISQALGSAQAAVSTYIIAMR